MKFCFTHSPQYSVRRHTLVKFMGSDNRCHWFTIRQRLKCVITQLDKYVAVFSATVNAPNFPFKDEVSFNLLVTIVIVVYKDS